MGGEDKFVCSVTEHLFKVCILQCARHNATAHCSRASLKAKHGKEGGQTASTYVTFVGVKIPPAGRSNTPAQYAIMTLTCMPTMLRSCLLSLQAESGTENKG